MRPMRKIALFVVLVAVIGCGGEPEPLTVEEYAREVCPEWLADLGTAETWGDGVRGGRDILDAIDVVPPEELREFHEAHVTLVESFVRFFERHPPDEPVDYSEPLGAPQQVALRFTTEAVQNLAPDVRAVLQEHDCI